MTVKSRLVHRYCAFKDNVAGEQQWRRAIVLGFQMGTCCRHLVGHCGKQRTSGLIQQVLPYIAHCFCRYLADCLHGGGLGSHGQLVLTIPTNIFPTTLRDSVAAVPMVICRSQDSCRKKKEMIRQGVLFPHHPTCRTQ